jgi:hypothetical protein
MATLIARDEGAVSLALLARIAVIALFCAFAVYLTASAFVPSMATGGWDYLFIAFAVLGLVLGAFRNRP